MIGDPFDHTALADAAITALAVVEHVEPGRLQRLDDGLPRRNGNDLPGRSDLTSNGRSGEDGRSDLKSS